MSDENKTIAGILECACDNCSL